MTYKDIVAAQLKLDEGCVRHAYQDSLGFWTIGVGRLIDKRRGGRLRDDEIDLMLANDIAEAEEAARRLFPSFDSLSDARKAVVCNMAFNLGETRLASFKRTIACIEAQDWAGASAAMLSARWAFQVGERAKRLAKAMVDG